ncbi:uncharacterized protein TRIVIDRAFT_222299 [Trichoderma virens Gv29-8]|uniref:Uncharacterized protein n=1 Tax=Hypocrea virens (strain Gv29-8 / FGSC 10586) TaxID=413071 RepID=G9MSU3_HYPVG|nr:uncharacterized protein TRIVIDRAFT_222299 [Trichoderma virens Gv29-8]EHK23040.1 hypothetical protein TRIVIDRAFT_222299 [Trichoderma virens Gv29-8]UKZ48100.1 hypothetical protein TrVGV298_002336 [Trichoderma virens]
MMLALIAAALGLSTCAFAAPLSINTTTESYSFHVVTATSNSSNFQLRLRPNQYDVDFGYPAGTFHYVGIDAADAVLVANLRDGVLYSQGRDADGSLYDLGPTGYINLKESVGTSSSYLFSFVNATIYPPALDAGWLLSPSDGGATYELLYTEAEGVVNGWRWCIADFDLDYGPWSYLEYFTYTDTPTFDSYCVPATVLATVVK